MPDAPVILPEQLSHLMQQLLPNSVDYAEFIAYCAKPLRKSLRVNTLKITVPDFLQLTAEYGLQLTPIPWCAEGFWLELPANSIPLGSFAEHLSGLFYLQEASSMLPVQALLDKLPLPATVLDMAAAPGSKTTQLAARMQNQGLILANELSSSRLKVLHANLSRSGVYNTLLTHLDGSVLGSALPEQFDAILLDAPCSGEGVIRKDPQALSNWSLASCQAIAATQFKLIVSAWHVLKPGGRLVYSTCTLNSLENQSVIQKISEYFADSVQIEPLNRLFPGAETVATREGFLHVFPQRFDSEGFFVASLRKRHAVPSPPASAYKTGKFPFTPLSQAQQQQLVTEAAKVGLTLPVSLTFWQRDKEIWSFLPQTSNFIGKLRLSRPGIRVAETFNKGYRWQHEAIMAFASCPNPAQFELNRQQAAQWFRGQDIFPSVPPQGNMVLVSYQQQPLGLAKCIGARIKNSLPRDLVRDGVLFDTFPDRSSY